MSAAITLDQRQAQTRAHLALAGAQVSFGLIPVFGQLVFKPGGLTPTGLGAWRIAAGAGILLAVSAAVHGRELLPLRADLGRFIIASILGIGLNQLLYLEGLSRSTPLNASLMMCLIPVFTITIATLVGHEAFRLSRVTGVAVALAGTLLLLFDRGFSGLGTYFTGNLLMAANSLSYSTYLVVAKPLLRKYPPLVQITWVYVLSLGFVPFFAWNEHLAPAAGHAAVWWSIAYIIVFPTVIAYILNMYALARVPASTTAIWIYSQPLITAIASWVAFRETPTAAMLAAAGALFLGIWLVSRE